MSEPAESPIDAAVMQAGQQHFLLCQACHGPQGQGIDMIGPPLAGSEWVNGPAENLIRIQLRGLQGPIQVKGKVYTFAAPMPAQPFQTDQQIANVLTFVRNSWNNRAPAVSADQVAALRSEVGKPALTAADLVPPTPTTGAALPTPAPAAGNSPAIPATPVPTPPPAQSVGDQPTVPPYQLATSTGLPVWLWGLVLAWIIVCLLPILRSKD